MDLPFATAIRDIAQSFLVVVLVVGIKFVSPQTIATVVQFVLRAVLTAVKSQLALVGWVIGATIVALVWVLAAAITAVRVFVVPAAIAVVGWTIAAVGWAIASTIAAVGWVILVAITALECVIAATFVSVVWVIAGIAAVPGWVVALVELVVPVTIAGVGSAIAATMTAAESVIAMAITGVEWVNAWAIIVVGWVDATIVAVVWWKVAVDELAVSPTITAAGSVVAAIIVAEEWVVAVVGWVIVATLTALGRVIYAVTATVVKWVVSWVGSVIAATIADWKGYLVIVALAVILAVIKVGVEAMVVRFVAYWPTLMAAFTPQEEIPIIPAPSTPASTFVVRPVEPRPGPSRSPNAGVRPTTRLAAAPSPPGSLNRLAEDASILLELFSQGSHNNDIISDEYHGMITNATEGVLTIQARLRQVNQRAVPRGVSVPDLDCIICYGERADTLFMPCKHLVVCTVYMSSARRWSSVVANRVVLALVW